MDDSKQKEVTAAEKVTASNLAKLAESRAKAIAARKAELHLKPIISGRTSGKALPTTDTVLAPDSLATYP